MFNQRTFRTTPRATFANGPDAWRYKYDNGRWWYWRPDETWAVRNGDNWEPYRERRRYQTGYRGPLEDRFGADRARYRDDRFRRWPGSFGYYGPDYYGRGNGLGGFYRSEARAGANIGGAIGGRAGARIGAAIGQAVD